MRDRAAACAIVAGLVLARAGAARAEVDAGGDAAFEVDAAPGSDAGNDAAPDAGSPALPVAAPSVPSAAPPPPPPDPAAAAAESAWRAEAAWPLAYVDRPQTLFKNMEAFSFSTSGYLGPPRYRRLIGAVGYARGITDELQIGLAFPRLFCWGREEGACYASLTPELSLAGGVVRTPTVRLELGGSVTDFVYGADVWTRLELVVPGRFSFELEPRLYAGVQSTTRDAWWNPGVPQDGNQSRLTLIFDANLQLGPHLLVWLDGVPYVPTSELGSPGEIALEVAAGASLSFTKSLELRASCSAADVRATRRWEYVPDFRGCSVVFVSRHFGARPVMTFHRTSPPEDLY